MTTNAPRNPSAEFLKKIQPPFPPPPPPPRRAPGGPSPLPLEMTTTRVTTISVRIRLLQDYRFLNEILELWEKARTDATRYEMIQKMLTDWRDEIHDILNKDP